MQRALPLLCNQVYFALQSLGERCAISTRPWPTFSQFAARLPPARRFVAMARQPSPPLAVWPSSLRFFNFFGFTIPPLIPLPFFLAWLRPPLGPGQISGLRFRRGRGGLTPGFP